MARAGRSAGIHFLAAAGPRPRAWLAVNCRPSSASRGCHIPWLVAPASAFKARNSGQVFLVNHLSGFLQPGKLHVIRLSPPDSLPISRSFCREQEHPQGLGIRARASLRGGESHYSTCRVARTKAQDKTNQGTSKTLSVQIRWLSSHKHFTPQNYLNSHTLHPEITNLK